MSQPISGTSQSKSISGLGTFSHTAGASQPYLLSISCTVPDSSGLVLSIMQNSTTLATASVTSPSQHTLQLQAPCEATIGDVMAFVLSSSASADVVPNAIKGVCNVSVL